MFDRMMKIAVWTCLVAAAACIFLPRTAQTSAPMNAPFRIVIDPGHGGEDGGAVSRSGVRESVLNLQIAKRTQALCGLMGIHASMTRSEDVSIHSEGAGSISEKKSSDLKNRVKIANNGDLLISIHQNHFSESKYSGAQVFYAPTLCSEELAKSVQKALAAVDPQNNRKAKKSTGVYLMEHVQVPAILVECGFLSNDRETELLQQADYQKKLALAILVPVANSRKAVMGDHEV